MCKCNLNSGLMLILLTFVKGRTALWEVFCCRYVSDSFMCLLCYVWVSDTIGPGEVGLKDESLEDERGLGVFGLNDSSMVARWSQPITFLDIHECDDFTVGHLYFYLIYTASYNVLY